MWGHLHLQRTINLTCVVDMTEGFDELPDNLLQASLLSHQFQKVTPLKYSSCTKAGISMLQLKLLAGQGCSMCSLSCHDCSLVKASRVITDGLLAQRRICSACWSKVSSWMIKQRSCICKR